MEGRKAFFFEEKKQKTFSPTHLQRIASLAQQAAANRAKFFGSFFQERTFFRASVN
jgi:hypothetical protein